MPDLVILQRDHVRAELSTLLDEKFETLLGRITSQQAPQKSDELLTRKDAAKYLGISLTTLWQWTNDGIVTGHRIAARVRYKKSELEQALRQIQTK
jgi:excisionase family DNA binding protein